MWLGNKKFSLSSLIHGPGITLIFWVEIQSTASLEVGLNGNEQAPAQIAALYWVT